VEDKQDIADHLQGGIPQADVDAFQEYWTVCPDLMDTRYNLSKTALLKVEFPLPDITEQTAIATLLSDMDAEFAALDAKLAKARGIKQGMMQELLTGRTRLV
jgi:hypothetical protein